MSYFLAGGFEVWRHSLSRWDSLFAQYSKAWWTSSQESIEPSIDLPPARRSAMAINKVPVFPSVNFASILAFPTKARVPFASS